MKKGGEWKMNNKIDLNPNISISAFNVTVLNTPIQKSQFVRITRREPIIICLQEVDIGRLKVRGWKKDKPRKH